MTVYLWLVVGIVIQGTWLKVGGPWCVSRGLGTPHHLMSSLMSLSVAGSRDWSLEYVPQPINSMRGGAVLHFCRVSVFVFPLIAAVFAFAAALMLVSL